MFLLLFKFSLVDTDRQTHVTIFAALNRPGVWGLNYQANKTKDHAPKLVGLQ